MSFGVKAMKKDEIPSQSVDSIIKVIEERLKTFRTYFTKILNQKNEIINKGRYGVEERGSAS